ncbi:MAG: hypothetical protein ACLQSX_02105 [Smithella sp.]
MQIIYVTFNKTEFCFKAKTKRATGIRRFITLVIVVKALSANKIGATDLLKMEWYSYGGHLEKRVIETKLLEVRYDNKEEELFEAI